MEHAKNGTGDNARFVFLDYLRIFAFVSVLVGHKFYAYVVALSNDSTVHATAKLIASSLLPVFNGGGAGVVVFFLVSGFIIVHVLQTEEPVEFIVKRVFRIYPLYIFAVLLEHVLLALYGQAPGLSTLLPQLLLVGDIFGTPYALNGVEWTLRLEIAFYVFMSVASVLKLTRERKKLLPYVLVGATLVCSFVSPIPAADVWSKGYVTIYGPFLLLGAVFYLFEKKQIGLTFFALFTGLVFLQYFRLIATYQQGWLAAHFAFLAFLIFGAAWAFQKHLTAAAWVLLLSDMTYAVYLLHNWFFEYAKKWLAQLSISILNADIQALIVLLLACFLLVRFVEKPGIRLGRSVLTRLQLRTSQKLD